MFCQRPDIYRKKISNFLDHFSVKIETIKKEQKGVTFSEEHYDFSEKLCLSLKLGPSGLEFLPLWVRLSVKGVRPWRLWLRSLINVAARWMLSASTCQELKSLVSTETCVRLTPFLATKANKSVKGKYGVGEGLEAQKQPEGKLTAGRHSRP